MLARTVVMLLIVSGIGAVLGAPRWAQADSSAPGFKNLQVLPKTTTKEQIKAIMRGQSKALDVDCDHCHDSPDMASDAKEEKKIARQMMKMQAEINEKWIKGMKDADKNQVTCGTCHRGKTTPEVFTPKK